MSIAKSIYWDLRDRYTRSEYLYEAIRNMPGRFGFLLRQKLVKRFLHKCGDNLKVHKGCRIIQPKSMEVGNNVRLGVDAYIQAGGGVFIGDETVMGPGVKIWSQTHEFDDPNLPLSKTGYKYEKVIIGSNVWIGANAFIMPGVQIKDGCVVSAGSVVGKKPWEENSIIAGNPARKMGIRGKLRPTEKQ